jgi:pseudouridine-5'-monophosphatase
MLRNETVNGLVDIKQVIFDLDGVLLDTEPLYTKATEQVIAPFGKVFDWSVKSGMMGRDALSSARHLVEQLALPISAETYLERKEPILLGLFPESKAMPGAQRLVERLHAGGRKLAVATSSSTEYYQLKITHHPWFNLFETVVCSDHPKVKKLKPAPDIFLTAAEQLGVPPGDCLVFEDSPAGARAAVAAGMRVVALPDPRVDLSAFPPVLAFIERFDELANSDLFKDR